MTRHLVGSLRGTLNSSREGLARCLAFFWPILYLFSYVLPFAPGALTIDNDFNNLYYRPKVYLLDGLSRMHLPLWSPSESCGFPFYSNPFAQAFYPLNGLLAIWYAVAGGYSYSDHQVFTVIGVSLFSLGIFLWLRSVNVSRRAALAATLIMSVSFKVTEALRFPNAIHAAAWLPFLLWGCVLALQRRTALKGGLVFFGATICLVTAGYPYYAYYSLFLVGPFLALLMFETTRCAIGVTAPTERGRCLLTVGCAGLSAALVCLPYLRKTAQLLSQTTDRGGKDFAFSTDISFGIVDTIGSLVYPPSAQIEGWYFFGFLSLFVILLHLIHTVLVRGGQAASDRVLFLSMAFWFVGITLITYGRTSLLFRALWNYLPGFSSLRVWGRLNIILVPILALMLGRAYMFLEAFLFGGMQRPAKALRSRMLLGMIPVFGLVLLCQVVLFHGRHFDPYWTEHYLTLHNRWDGILYEISPIAAGIVSFCLLVGTCRYFGARDVPSRSAPILTLISFVAVVSLDLAAIGRSCWAFRAPPPTKRTVLDIETVNRQSFSARRKDGAAAFMSHGPRFNVGVIQNWYFARYTGFLQSHLNRDRPDQSIIDDRDLESLLGISTGQRLFFSETIRDSSISEFLARASDFEKSAACDSRVEAYTGDRLTLVAGCQTSGYLSFIDNWDPDWTVRIDGREGRLELLFGTFKTVQIPAGRTKVEFVYRPFAKLF